MNVPATTPPRQHRATRLELPGLAWPLGFTGLPERRRLALMWAATAGYGAPVAVSVAPTGAGRAPFELGPAAAALTLASVALLAAAYGIALLALATWPQPPDQSPALAVFHIQPGKGF